MERGCVRVVSVECFVTDTKELNRTFFPITTYSKSDFTDSCRRLNNVDTRNFNKKILLQIYEKQTKAVFYLSTTVT